MGVARQYHEDGGKSSKELCPSRSTFPSFVKCLIARSVIAVHEDSYRVGQSPSQ